MCYNICLIMRKRNFERYETSNSRNNNGSTIKLDDSGLSIFRAVGGNELDICKDEFLKQTSKFSRMVRGEIGQYGLSLTLVSLVEVKRQQFKQDIETQEVIDEIYDEVPSLRRHLKVRLGRVGVFGYKNAKQRSISVSVHKDSRQQINDERNTILEILNQHTEGTTTRDDWFKNEIPHISLGKLLIDGEINHQHQELLRSMTEVVPEELKLDRATFYNPSK